MPRGAKIALIVFGILLAAFVVQRVVDPSENGADVSYGELLDRLERQGEIAAVVFDQDDGELEVTPGPASTETDEYEVGYLDQSSQELVTTLRENQIRFDVEPEGGGSLISWFFYLLPFALFLLFWRWLARQFDGIRSASGDRPS